jgi:4'-phosphopantetheinyl transferase
MRPGAVRLRWCAPAAAPAAWWETLSPEERARAGRFRFEEDCRAYVAAHGLTRALLSEVGGLPPGAWRFVTGRAGKPEVDPALGLAWLRFNLTHTRSLVACAVAAEDDIGADVEDLGRRPVDPGVAERHFAPEEVALLAGLPPERWQETFLRIWTLKEAFVKATGDGLGLGLHRFAFGLDPLVLRRAPDGIGTWRFLEWRPTPRHVLALAFRRRGPGGTLSPRRGRGGGAP